MYLDEIRKDIYKKKLDNFFENFHYDDMSKRYIRMHFGKYDKIFSNTTLIKQVSAYLNLLKDEQNIYYQMAKYILSIYGYDKNILEVSCGHLPMLSYYMEREIKINGGKSTITVCDPLLVPNKFGSLKLVKDEFNEEMDISDYELIVGLFPCEATRSILKKSILNDKEFFVALCSCLHIDEETMYYSKGNIPTYQDQFDSLKNLAMHQENNGFIVTNEDVLKCPILRSKKK